MSKLNVVVLPHAFLPSDSLAQSHERMLGQVRELSAGLKGGVVLVSRPSFLERVHLLLYRMAESRTFDERRNELTGLFGSWLDNEVAPCLKAVVPDVGDALARFRVPMLSASTMEAAVIGVTERYHAGLERQFACLPGPWLRPDPRRGQLEWRERASLSAILGEDCRVLLSAVTLEHVPSSRASSERVPGSAVNGERVHTLLPWYDDSVIAAAVREAPDGDAELTVCHYPGRSPAREIYGALPKGLPVRDHALTP